MDDFEDKQNPTELEARVQVELEGAITETEPFDESSLLELAKNEGLADALVTSEIEEMASEAEADHSKPIELSEAEQAEITSGMETILFMSDRPVSLPKLRSVIRPETPLSVYRALMAKLRAEYAQDHRGIEIAEVSLGFQLRTKPHMASILRKMVKTQPLKLSSTNMEVLAICAYKQPVTKDEIDQLRGVDSGYVLRNLMEKRLVRIAGRSDLPGKPMVYGTTHEFLELFSLKDVKGLPPLHEVEAMVAASEVGTEEKMQTVMDEFSKFISTTEQKILFDDSKIDEELEAIRAEIANVPTSTAFIDEQKAKEKLDAKLAELATQGLTLNAEGKVVPIGSIDVAVEPEIAAEPEVAAEPAVTIELELAAETNIEHQPSGELEEQAAAAQWERHAAIISQAVADSNQESIQESLQEQKLDAEREPEHNPELS